MAPRPGSPYADLPICTVTAPDGGQRRVVALRLTRPPIAAAGRYRLAEGEAVDLLAKRFYGAEGLWWRILDVNPIVHPFDLEPGEVLELPDKAPATRANRARGF